MGIQTGGLKGIPGGPFNQFEEVFIRREKPGGGISGGTGGRVMPRGSVIFVFHGQFISLLCISADQYKLHGIFSSPLQGPPLDHEFEFFTRILLVMEHV